MPKMRLPDHFVIVKKFFIIFSLLVLQGRCLEGASSSVCSKYHTRVQSRLVSYLETYTKRKIFWRRQATRINYRWETYTEWYTLYECCPGYEPKPDVTLFSSVMRATATCLPICSSGCTNGKCIAPNTCICNLGYRATVTNNACVPDCMGHGPDGCGAHGSCSAPNKCICDNGYTLSDTDYTDPTLAANITGNGERPQYCRPSCEPPCINGACTEPGHCQCFPGYMKTSTSWQYECLPICNPSCINALCTRPDYCECKTGYHKIDGNPHVCLPHCDPPCINGTCTKPGHCECYTGYYKKSNNSQVCSPHCDPPCVNGICTGTNHCECFDGYANVLNGQPEICSPVCISGCNPNAFCHAPDTCLCNTGYTVDNIQPYLGSTSKPLSTLRDIVIAINRGISCKPACESECNENESCVAPNTCQCNSGYQPEVAQGNLTRCLPICASSCVNAYCGQPNKCICLPGYEPSHDDKFVCNPVCQNDCFNATCTRPNYCECYDGYEKALTSLQSPNLQENYQNTCIPSCPEQCLNGTCIAPGQCACEPGYVLESTLMLLTTSTETATDQNSNSTTSMTETSVQFCRPLCEPRCPIGSECLSPNQCEPQSDDNQDINEMSTNSTHVINSIEECGRNVDFLDENGKCVCRYGWNGWYCEKPSLCGLVIRDGFTDNEKFTTVQSTTDMSNDTMETTYDDSNDMRMISSDEDSGVLIDWEGPMCNEVCRIMTSSEISANRSDDAVKCYLLESENVTNGVFSIRNQVILLGSRNGTFVCFISIDSLCNVSDLEIVGPVDTLIPITIGTIVVILLVVVVGFIIYSKKNRAIADNPNYSTVKLMNSESITLYNTEESSSL